MCLRLWSHAIDLDPVEVEGVQVGDIAGVVDGLLDVLAALAAVEICDEMIRAVTISGSL